MDGDGTKWSDTRGIQRAGNRTTLARSATALRSRPYAGSLFTGGFRCSVVMNFSSWKYEAAGKSLPRRPHALCRWAAF